MITYKAVIPVIRFCSLDKAVDIVYNESRTDQFPFHCIGVLNYTLAVAIPSLYCYWTNYDYNKYYSLPWEFIAESNGEVYNRTNLLTNKPYVYSSYAVPLANKWYEISTSTSEILNVYKSIFWR